MLISRKPGGRGEGDSKNVRDGDIRLTFHRGQTSEHANKNKLRRQTSTLHRVLNTSNFFGKRLQKMRNQQCWNAGNIQY